ncbi:MAG: SOS response-associated peptidase [Oscillospiraceae bacterium]|nr:SOS response-associated peptidase [Oscillospiraceae bacterium]
MCGRYYIAIEEDELRDIGEEAEKIVRAFSEPIPLKLQGEIFPTNVVPVRTGADRYVPMKWGFTGFDKKAIINARSETALQKPMFKRAMLERRCLVPASGYYEWKRGGEKKIRYQIYKTGEPIYFAGCYRQEKGSPLRTFVILTRAAANGLEEIHDRMPVIIPRSHIMDWLGGDMGAIESADVNLEFKPAV